MKKNVAGQVVYFYAWDISVSAPKTGDAANISGEVSLDGGAFAALTNSVSEISKGHYKVVPTQAETNADQAVYNFESTDINVIIDPRYIDPIAEVTISAQVIRDAMKLSPSAGAATTDSIDGKLDRAADIREADSEVNLTTNPAQGTLDVKTKGTSTVILKKNLIRPDGSPVTAVEHLVAGTEDVVI